MTFLLHANFWLVVLGTLFILRKGFLIMLAEQGRKQDLAKRQPLNLTDYHLSVLIPHTEPGQYADLMTLLDALGEQSYPASRIAIHLGATAQTAPDLNPALLKPNVKVWTMPTELTRGETQPEWLTSWLIERCLANTGYAGMYVFLNPTDLIKGDFLQQIVTHGYDSFAIQGYVASKRYPESPLAKVVTLAKRLQNRIHRAGQYHIGFSTPLALSGWAVKQDVLEMVPYRHGKSLDNLEYTIRLNLESIRVKWTPAVVVYTQDEARLLPWVTQHVMHALNRVSLLGRYGFSLVSQAVTRTDGSALALFSALLSPTAFWTGAVLILLTLASWTGHPLLPGSTLTYAFLTGSVVLLHMLSLVVSRCRAGDLLTSALWTPVYYGLAAVIAPVSMIYLGLHALAQRRRQGTLWQPVRPPAGKRYTQHAVTRFNDAMDPTSDFYEDPSTRFSATTRAGSGFDQLMADDLSFGELIPKAAPQTFQSGPPQPVLTASAPQAPVTLPGRPQPMLLGGARPPSEQIRTVPLMMAGKRDRQVQCELRIITHYDDAMQQKYQLVMTYKSASFATQQYRILDQAFYELHAKLKSRHLTMVTCGSCAYFYNPTADVPGALDNAGVCLFGKLGRDVDIATDAVTVVSQACEYHDDVSHREKVVKQWQNSLNLQSVR
ncbi:MAG: hypothetical protein AB7P76_01515 [Candidatus Melainabacteria bacterium]